MLSNADSLDRGESAPVIHLFRPVLAQWLEEYRRRGGTPPSRTKSCGKRYGLWATYTEAPQTDERCPEREAEESPPVTPPGFDSGRPVIGRVKR